MKILFLTDNFPPEVNAPASRTYEHCREWVQMGHQVVIITGAPNFPKGEVYPGYKNSIYSKEHLDGIEVRRVWTYITKNEGFLKRVLDYVSFMFAAILASTFVRKPDIVIGTSPQFFTACAAYVVGLLKRRPYVFELRDIWPESIRAVGAMKSSKVLDLLEKLEEFLYRKAHLVVSVTHSFKRVLSERGINTDHVRVVTNGVNLQHFQPGPKDPQLLLEHGLNDKIVLGYIGTHGMAHSLFTVLEAAEKFQNSPYKDKIRILFLGDGAEKNKLKIWAKNKKLDNVIFVDSVSKDLVVKYWNLIDISLVHLKKTPLFKSVIPSKIFESFAMRKPLLLGVEGESADIVRESKTGLTFEPENSSDLFKKVEMILTDSHLYENMVSHCRKQADIYNRTHLAKAYINYLTGAHESTSQQVEPERSVG